MTACWCPYCRCSNERLGRGSPAVDIPIDIVELIAEAVHQKILLCEEELAAYGIMQGLGF
jgi:hypothetical protein